MQGLAWPLSRSSVLSLSVPRLEKELVKMELSTEAKLREGSWC